jgi:hypothetical protein
MWSWVKSWIWKPEEKEPEYPKQIVYPRGHYTLTPVRIMEWWARSPKLDPLPPYPKDEK